MGNASLVTNDDTVPTPAYELGHSDRELERLKAQARLIDPITRQFFREAGIASGMRVLDVGSGAGDVAFLAAELVGEAGEVVGVDRAPAAIAAAQTRANARSLRNVSFSEGDAMEMAFEQPFDAVVGRYVLLFQADSAGMVRKLSTHVRPRGLIVFHEPDWSVVRSVPPTPTYDRCCKWITETFRHVGTDTNMAVRLYGAFTGANLPMPTMRMQTFISGPAGCEEWLESVAELAISLVPTMEQLGIATAADVNIEALAVRMQNEVVASGSVIIGRSEIGAWSRVDRLEGDA